MSEPFDTDETQIDRDIEAICLYMSNRLDPQAKAEVARRLEQEPEFFALAGGLMFVAYAEGEQDFAPPDPQERTEGWTGFEQFAIRKYRRRRRRRRLYAGAILIVIATLAIMLIV